MTCPVAASLPPGPRSWLGATIAYVRDPMGAHERWRARHGDPFTTFLGRNQTVITARAEAIRDIFAAPVGAYAASSLGLEEIGGAQSVMTLEGAAHVAMRRLLSAAMLDRRNELSPGIILEIARRHVAGWPRGRAVAALPLLSRIALEAILRAVCGVRDDAAVQRFERAFEGLNRTLGVSIMLVPALRRDFGRWSPWGRFVRARRGLTDLFDVEIALARAGARAGAPGGRTDALANMVAMRGEDGRPALDDAALHDNLIALLFAGHLTTASSLAWAVHWIWATPGVLDRLREELGDFARDGDPEAALTAPYLEAVCRETLRIRPVSPLLARTLAGPMVIAGHLTPGGCWDRGFDRSGAS